ncbi:hypothetical protein [Variovorax sp. LT1P1]|uniref:hypothetical protein n=1 Tax=Variovorax sp. LT1P1 TaxID=3443730 RepID=UPI003F499838
MPLIHRLAALTCTVMLVAGCAAPTGGGALHASQDPFASLSPAEALTPQAQGTRVRWSGGIRSVDRRAGNRACFTLLHATSDSEGYLRWPPGGQTFIACGPGDYDDKLIEPFVLLSIEGRVAGQETLQRQPVPVIEIDLLHRHSDCVQGSEDSPECYAGPLRPRTP